MDTMSLREKAIFAVLGMVLLYALAAGLWFFSQEAAWKHAKKSYEKAKTTYQNERKLIGEKRKWEDAYETEKSRMPMFEEGKSTDTTWLSKMDALASTNNIVISQRQVGQEVSGGDVLELPIEVKNWEGSLEALVKFLYGLENGDAGMFDIRALNFKPNAKTGYLKGSFTLTCAYMRE